ncbi:MAG: ATP-binding cassette domain-containing protein [Phycisphaerales bacterium]|nr:ATP-binding cassette domain-containing protein [Phycisphaerales bacterium]
MTGATVHNRSQASTGDGQPLLSVQNLSTYFPVRTGLFRRVTGQLKAVDDVSFDLHRGHTLGLVGESGCGKSTLARTILRLIKAHSGNVNFDGQNLMALSGRQLRRQRQSMQIIFQDPVGSLNPRLRIGSIVGEPLRVHRIASGKELQKRVHALLEECGMPASAAQRFPHEFSGGQRQRIGIARALALEPRLVVCDEPTSALDVSIQAQILNLLQDLQDRHGLAYLFISHDMAVISHICDRIAVMNKGKIVELGPRDQVVKNPQHPYTQRLLAAVPTVDNWQPPTQGRPLAEPAVG